MRLKWPPFLTLLLLLSAVLACQDEPESVLNQAPVDATKVLLQTPPDKIKIQHQTERLQQQVRLKRQSVSIVSQQRKSALDFEVKLLAEIEPPALRRGTYQVQNIRIDGAQAYISYQRAGADYGGAVSILDLSNPLAPRLQAELINEELAYQDLIRYQDKLFVVGANAEHAVLDLIQLTPQGSGFKRELGFIELPSRSSRQIKTRGSDAYIAVGDTGGGVVRIDLERFEQTGFYSLDDARNLELFESSEGPRLGVFAGTPGRLEILDTELKSLKRFFFPKTATIPYSRSSLEIQNSVAYLGASNGGAMSVELESGKVIQQSLPAEGLTHDVALPQNKRLEYAFLAEGGDGVAVARLNRAQGTLQRLGRLDLGARFSSALLHYQDGLLYVGGPDGQVKILRLGKEQSADALYPLLECVSQEGQTLTAHLGYWNVADTDILLAVGPNNRSNLREAHQFLPTYFEAGRSKASAAFQLRFSQAEEFIWKLGNHQIKAHKDSPRCGARARYQSLLLRHSSDRAQASKNLSDYTTRLTLHGGARLLGVLYDKGKSRSVMTRSDRLFASLVSPLLPSELALSPSRALEQGDRIKRLSSRTLLVSGSAGSGGDDLRVIVDHGTQNTESSLEVRSNFELFVGGTRLPFQNRPLLLSTATGPIFDRRYHGISKKHPQRLLILREGVLRDLQALPSFGDFN